MRKVAHVNYRLVSIFYNQLMMNWFVFKASQIAKYLSNTLSFIVGIRNFIRIKITSGRQF